MTSIIAKLHTKGLIKPPMFVVGGSQYEVLMGSSAYGVSGDHSDSDVYAFCIPSKDLVFPHLTGEIHGFGTQHQRFGQFQQHHVDSDGTQYDLVSFNIIKYFQLCLDNNPNMIDSLFVPQRCIVFTTQIGQMVREARKKFLHRGAWHKFKGYAYSQMASIRRRPEVERFKHLCDTLNVPYDVQTADILAECRKRGLKTNEPPKRDPDVGGAEGTQAQDVLGRRKPVLREEALSAHKKEDE